MISVYADGSSEGNSVGAIGWAWVIVRGVEQEVLDCGNGGGPVGTNNIAELTGAIEGMRALKKLKDILGQFDIDVNEAVELVSDSQYVLGIACGRFKAIKNIELAKEIRALTVELKASTRWVKGHNGDVFNEKCDELAKAAKFVYAPNKITKKMERRKRRQIVKEFKRRHK
jgi:ribonuclease HI